jgi:predicted DCC family thiol-disulfide oxidoreductase YuxK
MLVVIFDADCGVCQASVGWLKARDRHGVFQFAGNDLQPLPDGVSQDETEHTVVVLDGARKFVRGAAVSRLLRELRGWSVAGQALRVPGIAQLANFGYDQFAKRRHKVSAALGLTACKIPDRAAVSVSSGTSTTATDPPGAAASTR